MDIKGAKMAEYTNEFSSFPENIDIFKKFRDINDNVKPIIEKYMTYLSQGNISEAVKVLNENDVSLEDYQANANDWNKFFEAERNTEIMAKQKAQVIHYGDTFDDPPSLHDVWI